MNKTRHSVLASASLLLSGLLAGGCNFLDVVPNDTATLDHVFANRSVTEKFLRTCYSFLPDPLNPATYPAYFTSTDEFTTSDARTKATAAGRIAQGLQNTNDPYQNYWSGRQGGKALYQGIRNCNIFLENIHTPQDIEEEERLRWIGEVTFLKAYYHFFLLQLYGPIVLVRNNLPLSSTPDEVKVWREPVDECVDYIVELLDEAIPNLPLVLPDPAGEQGRITAAIAMGIKAKVLAWGASPLFNGNPDYADWTDKRGKALIPQTYDPAKWERAAAAAKAAIDTCHAAGLQLYTFNKLAGGPQCFRMNDTTVQLMTIRKAITEDIERNTGVIWASQEASGTTKPGNSTGWLNHMIRQLFPFLYVEDLDAYMATLFASWHMTELFYSNHGVPIDEDKTWNYADRLGTRRITPGDKHESYLKTGETTVNLHFNREPRFYADLGIDRGFYELATTTKDGGATFSPFIKMRMDEVRTIRNLSYWVKKLVPFEASGSQGLHNRQYSHHDYRFPLLRLADLYLLYAEALNEVKAKPDAEVYEWIDRVRHQAGVPGVVEAWQQYASNPDKPSTRTGMRDIIRRERLIELAFEGQRFWDIRRWKIADRYWGLQPVEWNYSQDLLETYKVENFGKKREVTFRDYLWPIRDEDLRINTNLVQTWGW